MKKNMDHHLYKTGDADAPAPIKDRNGTVVLQQCRMNRWYVQHRDDEMIDRRG